MVLVNLFALNPADEADFLAIWQDDAAFMKAQPGFISTQLHRAVGPSPTFLNYAVWETTGHFAAAFSKPEFQNKLAAYPASAVVSPPSVPDSGGAGHLRGVIWVPALPSKMSFPRINRPVGRSLRFTTCHRQELGRLLNGRL